MKLSLNLGPQKSHIFRLAIYYLTKANFQIINSHVLFAILLKTHVSPLLAAVDLGIYGVFNVCH